MTVNDDDIFDYSNIDGYDPETHMVTRNISVTVTGTVSIISMTVTDTGVTVSYGYSAGYITSTADVAFNDVTLEMVDYMNNSDIQLVISFVNGFTAASGNMTLTDAQLEAINSVLANDYGNVGQ